MKREFSRKEVEDLLGIPVRRIQFYTDMELIKMKESNPGKGRGRKYSRTNLFEILVVHELSDGCGLELARVKRIMKTTRKEQPEMFDLKKYSGDEPSGMYLMYSRRDDNLRFLSEKSTGSREMEKEKKLSPFEKLQAINLKNLQELEDLSRVCKENFIKSVNKNVGYELMKLPEIVKTDQKIQINLHRTRSAIVVNLSYLADITFGILGEKV